MKCGIYERKVRVVRNRCVKHLHVTNPTERAWSRAINALAVESTQIVYLSLFFTMQAYPLTKDVNYHSYMYKLLYSCVYAFDFDLIRHIS